ncbi:hypothetical protein BGZ49_005303, partial [Haplosporangium sp. Z 27]
MNEENDGSQDELSDGEGDSIAYKNTALWTETRSLPRAPSSSGTPSVIPPSNASRSSGTPSFRLPSTARSSVANGNGKGKASNPRATFPNMPVISVMPVIPEKILKAPIGVSIMQASETRAK